VQCEARHGEPLGEARIAGDAFLGGVDRLLAAAGSKADSGKRPEREGVALVKPHRHPGGLPPLPPIRAASSSGQETARLANFAPWSDALRGAIEVQNGLIERNAGAPDDRRIDFPFGTRVSEWLRKATAT
jgi:hypothetical protein